MVVRTIELHAVTAVTSALSALGSTYLIASILVRWGKGHHKRELHHMNLLVMSLFDLGLSISYASGQSALPVIVGTEPSPGCIAQAVCIQFFGLCGILWMGWLSLAVLVTLTNKQHLFNCANKASLREMSNLRRLLVPLSCVLVLSGICAAAPGALNAYGPARFWCWIGADSPKWERDDGGLDLSLENRQIVGLCVFYFPLLVAWVLAIFSTVKSRQIMERRIRKVEIRRAKNPASAGQPATPELSHNTSGSHVNLAAAKHGHEKMVLYLAVFVAFFFFGLLFRLIGLASSYSTEGVDSNALTTFQYLMAIFVPLQGFGNAMVYTRWPQKLYFILTNGFGAASASRSSVAEQNSFGGMVIGHTTKASLHFGDATEQLKEQHAAWVRTQETATQESGGDTEVPKVRIFAATWNLGEAKSPSAEEMRGWLPPDAELYAIGLQECLEPATVASTAHEALGGSDKYVLYEAKSIGSGATHLGYHGFISIIVLAKKGLVDSGELSHVKEDAGAVKRGKKVIPGQRLANKGAVCRIFRYGNTSIAFVACHLAADSKAAGAAASKTAKRNKDAASLLQGLQPDGVDDWDLHFTCHHTVMLGDLNYRVVLPVPQALRLMAAGNWDALIAADELSEALASREVLYGFREAPLDFLPSYRRVKGAAGTLVTAETPPLSTPPLARLEETYTLAAKGKPRTPSYTDRVLVHSLPDLRPSLKHEGGYTCAEQLAHSDHRPVSCNLLLLKSCSFASTTPLWQKLRCQLHLENLRCMKTRNNRRSSRGSSSRDTEGSESSPNPHQRDEESDLLGAEFKLMSMKDSALFELALPMPAEDPEFVLNSLVNLTGSVRTHGSDMECITWKRAKSESGVTIVADVPVGTTAAAHALIKLGNAQGVLGIVPPWAQGACPPSQMAGKAVPVSNGPFSIELSSQGKYVGELRGVASTKWCQVTHDKGNMGEASVEPSYATTVDAAV